MRFLGMLKASPAWFVLPSLVVACVVGAAASGYQPLEFDPSLFETPQAHAVELDMVDAEAIEAANEAPTPPTTLPTAAPVASNAALADGTWTGYAACGQGNTDRWKPYYVGVTVEVSGGKARGITSVFGSSTGNEGSTPLSWDAAENQKYLSWAQDGRNGEAGVVSQINALAAQGAVPGVDTVSKATYSSVAIYNAYNDALAKSASAAGSPSSPAVAGPQQPAPSKGAGKQPEKVTVSEPDPGTLSDGDWTGYAPCGPDPDDDWKAYYVGVTVTVRDGKATGLGRVFGSSEGEEGEAVLAWDERENGVYLESAEYGVRQQIESSLAAGRNPSGIDAVSGATFSSRSIFEAYYAALRKSAAAAGSTIEIPDPSDDEAHDSEGGGDAPGDDTQGGATGEEEGGGSDEGGDQPADASTVHYGYALCDSSGAADSWGSYYVFVAVRAVDGVVTEIASAYGDDQGIVDPANLYKASENALYLNWAIDGKFGGTGYRMKSIVKQIQAKLDAGAEVSGISTVSGATRSSRAIIDAYAMAAANAAAGVGLSPEEAAAL